MRIFTKLELLGEWSKEDWDFTLFQDDSLVLKWKNGDKNYGHFKIFETFLIFNYSNGLLMKSWTCRIEDLKKNVLTLTDLSNDIGQLEIMHKTYFNIDLIKKFSFQEVDNLTIREIKELLELETLHLNTLKDSQGNSTTLYRHWENDSRFAINIEKELVERIKEDQHISLSIKKEMKVAKFGHFTNFIITEYYEDEDDYEFSYDYDSRYEKYNGAYGFDDFTIDSAFDGDPENYWNID